MSDLNISHGKMSGFVSFPFFGFTLFIKLRNFDFGSHWNILIFSDQEMMSDLKYALSKNVWIGSSFVVCLQCWQWVYK